MRVLAFDCAGSQCAGAILDADAVLAAARLDTDRGHAQKLLPFLGGLLAEARLGFVDIDRFAVTTGPGSFTGIRVALATAHGLALATGKPVVGLTTFEIYAHMAAAAGAEDRILVAVESRRAEIFLQLFRRDGSAAGEPAMLPPDAAGGWAGSEPVTLAGDAALRVAPFVTQPSRAPAPDAAIDPVALARIAARRQPSGMPAPFYLRAPDAVPARVG